MRCVAFACIAALLLVACATAAGPPPPTFAPDVGPAFNVTCGKGGHVWINFRRRLGVTPSQRLEIVITGVATLRGTILARSKGYPMHTIDLKKNATVRTSWLNRFQYQAQVVPGTTDAHLRTPRYAENVGFEGSIDGRPIKGVVRVDVVNRPPWAVRGHAWLVPGQPRDVTVTAYDPDRGENEIVGAWVSTLPTAGCTLQRIPEGNGTVYPPITGASRNFTVPDMRGRPVLRVTMPKDVSKCEFQFQVADSCGAASNAAHFRLEAAPQNPPRVYRTTSILRPGKQWVYVSLTASSPVPGNVTISIASLPKHGTLHNLLSVDDEELMPALELGKNGRTAVHTGPERRWTLVYTPNRNRKALVKTDSFEFTASNAYGEAAPATATIRMSKTIDTGTPKCSDRVFDPVFADAAIPLVSIPYEAPVGGHINRLRLIGTPWKGSRFGELKWGTTALTLGRYFSLRNGTTLAFIPRTQRAVSLLKRQKSVTGKYSFKVFADTGRTCVSSVTFVLRSHIAPPASYDGPFEQRQQALTNTFTLLELRAPELAADKIVTRAVLTALPHSGKLYAVINTPALQGALGGGGLLAKMPYCSRFNCYDIRGAQLVDTNGGTDVQPVLLGPQKTKRFFLLYRGKANAQRDAFEFSLMGGASPNSTDATVLSRQRVSLALRRGRLRQVVIPYDPPTGRLRPDLPRPVNPVLCQLGTSRQVVRVLPRDRHRRHNVTEEYTLFQLGGVDGGKPVPGDRLFLTKRFGIMGGWLGVNNSVVLLPKATSTSHIFKFRVRIYPVTGGSIDNTVYEDVRVIVRRSNTPPVWDTRNTNNLTVVTGVPGRVMLTALDDEYDSLSFLVVKGPRYGQLRFETMEFGVTRTRLVGTASRLVLPLLSIPVLSLHFVAPQNPALSYPLTDSFTIAAYDGEEYSKYHTVQVLIMRGADVAPAPTHSPPSAIIALSLVAGGVVIAITVTAVMVRRRRRQVYMNLPVNNDPEA